jgi:murein L,D-transpeptidase YcbB/YkuD
MMALGLIRLALNRSIRALAPPLLLLALSASVHPPAYAAPLSSVIGGEVFARLSEADVSPFTDDPLVAETLRAFYSGRGYEPAWMTGYRPTPEAYALLDAVARAEAEGLRPWFYGGPWIEDEIARMKAMQSRGEHAPPARLADLDLRLSTLFFSFGHDIITGRVNPALLDGAWADETWEANLPAVLASALRTGMVREAMASFSPPYPAYYGLRTELARYRAVAASGGWPVIGEGTEAAPGGSDPRIAPLRTRLAIEGYDTGGAPVDADLLDPALASALGLFQARHGLPISGALDAATRAALDVPATDRIRAIELNMERWRWLPRTLGETHVMVNIADFSLRAVERGAEVMRMRIVAGRPYWHTPSMSGPLSALVLNPSWHVPRSIAEDELLPAARRDPGTLARQGLTVRLAWNDDAPAVSPADIDWTSPPEGLRFVQPPGPGNPLGNMKFLFPNGHNVYLHDTPRRSLFARTVRTFSHGCIRIERPLDLAAWLLRGAEGWDRAAVEAALAGGGEMTLALPEPRVPIHILYFTAWVAEDGALQFRNDVYGRDPMLAERFFGIPGRELAADGQARLAPRAAAVR